MEEKRCSGNSSMTHCRLCNGSEPANKNLHGSSSLQDFSKEAKNAFFGQTTSLHGNAVNSLLKLIDVQLEIRLKSSGKSIVKT